MFLCIFTDYHAAMIWLAYRLFYRRKYALIQSKYFNTKLTSAKYFCRGITTLNRKLDSRNVNALHLQLIANWSKNFRSLCLLIWRLCFSTYPKSHLKQIYFQIRFSECPAIISFPEITLAYRQNARTETFCGKRIASFGQILFV